MTNAQDLTYTKLLRLRRKYLLVLQLDPLNVAESHEVEDNMPCNSTDACPRGVKAGQAQPVAICGIEPVLCGEATYAFPVSVVCDTTATTTWTMSSGTETVPNGGNVVFNVPAGSRTLAVYNSGNDPITLSFNDTGAGAHTQIVPPATSHTFSLSSNSLPFAVAFTAANASANDIDIIWNSSTIGGF